MGIVVRNAHCMLRMYNFTLSPPIDLFVRNPQKSRFSLKICPRQLKHHLVIFSGALTIYYLVLSYPNLNFVVGNVESFFFTSQFLMEFFRIVMCSRCFVVWFLKPISVKIAYGSNVKSLPYCIFCWHCCVLVWKLKSQYRSTI